MKQNGRPLNAYGRKMRRRRTDTRRSCWRCSIITVCVWTVCPGNASNDELCATRPRTAAQAGQHFRMAKRRKHPLRRRRTRTPTAPRDFDVARAARFFSSLGSSSDSSSDMTAKEDTTKRRRTGNRSKERCRRHMYSFFFSSKCFDSSEFGFPFIG